VNLPVIGRHTELLLQGQSLPVLDSDLVEKSSGHDTTDDTVSLAVLGRHVAREEDAELLSELWRLVQPHVWMGIYSSGETRAEENPLDCDHGVVVSAVGNFDRGRLVSP